MFGQEEELIETVKENAIASADESNDGIEAQIQYIVYDKWPSKEPRMYSLGIQDSLQENMASQGNLDDRRDIKTAQVSRALNSSHHPSLAEANAHVRTGIRLKQDSEVEGLRLGRYPFASAVTYYMERRYGIVTDSTYAEEAKKLKYLSKVFEELKTEGRINGTDPRRLRRRDIQEFMA